MLTANLLLALLWAASPEPPPADGAVAPPPAATQPQLAPQPQPAPAQPYPVYQAPPQTGIGLLIAGPLTVAIGIPFSFLGNSAWRDNCGPTSSNRQCADGSFASGGAHTLTGFAFAGGIAMTAAGASRKGRVDAGRDPTNNGAGFIAGGAVLLPTSLIGMGMVRLFLWLPTPECQTYACVQRLQSLSSATVGGLALGASVGAGLLMYGATYNRHRPRLTMPVAVLPQFGGGFSGLQLTGQF